MALTLLFGINSLKYLKVYSLVTLKTIQEIGLAVCVTTVHKPILEDDDDDDDELLIGVKDRK